MARFRFLPLTLLLLTNSLRADEAPPGELKGAAGLAEIAARIQQKLEAPAGEDGADDSAMTLLTTRWEGLAKRRAADPRAEITVPEWLQLFDLYERAIDTGQFRDFQRLSSLGEEQQTSLFTFLPAPGQWPALSTALREKKVVDAENDPITQALRLVLADYLVADLPALRKNWQQLQTLLEASAEEAENPHAAGLASWQRQLSDGIPTWLAPEASPFEALKKRIESLSEDDYHQIEIPSVSEHFTAAQARKIWTLLLPQLHRRVHLRLPGDEASLAIPIELILANPELPAAPYWGLVSGPKAHLIYDIYQKRFPAALAESERREHYQWRVALEQQLVSRYLADPKPEVLAQDLAKLPADSHVSFYRRLRAELRKAERQAEFFELLKDQLAADPSLKLWPQLIESGIDLKRSEEVLALARQGLAKAAQNPESQPFPALRILADAALSADQIDEGLAHLRQSMALSKAHLAEDKEAREAHNAAAQNLHRLGLALERPELRREALDALRANARAVAEDTGNSVYASLYEERRLADILIKEAPPAETEAFIFKQLEKLSAAQLREMEESHYPGNLLSRSSGLRQWQEVLVSFYEHEKRPEDLVASFAQGPFWGSADLSTLIPEVPKAALALARALHQNGESAQAREILTHILRSGELTGHDPAYALLLDLREDDEKTLAFLDELYAADAFEERPLIWKARLLLTLNQAGQAREVIEKAISIDPSDGEQGKGDRMRAYTVLADINEAQGKAEDAEFFREVIRAIRLSEQADTIYAAGLKSRGVALYEKALTHFADAYCIQSRLALLLNGLGRHEEAARHYRRAFELMPDSFGRMESHCFGCEGAFSGSTAQSIAEEVFTELAEKTPGNPRVHYLFGYLREAQKNPALALESYLKAVELDPDYINAWKKIASLASSGTDFELRDRALLAQVRLDPYARRGSPNLNEFFNLPALAQTLLALPEPPVLDAKLYPLPASQQLIDTEIASFTKRLEEQENGMQFSDVQIRQIVERSLRSRTGKTSGNPAARLREALVENSFLSHWLKTSVMNRQAEIMRGMPAF
ncbi:MAG: tetratricopeptide repeat protein [Verrucomicrobiales bacterium]